MGISYKKRGFFAQKTAFYKRGYLGGIEKRSVCGVYKKRFRIRCAKYGYLTPSRSVKVIY